MTEPSEVERVAEARTRIIEVTADEAIARRTAGSALFLDVRERHEWNLFRIPGAMLLPIGDIPASAPGTVPRDRDLIVYCGQGNRSVLATDLLRSMGYARAASLSGGVRAWMDAGGELED